jgi:molybdopterin-guanine dinucleotide biosynthesis protein A
MQTGAIILCGGKSSRMGRDKASLPFGPEVMLQRVVRLISEVVERANIVVVAAANQSLPDLPPEVVNARDEREYRGPLEGLANGLRALGGRVDAAYATACDVPLLAPAFVQRILDSLEDFEIAVPRDEEHYHPLAAVYRPTVLAAIESLLAADQLRPRFLFDRVRTREIDVNVLRAVDSELLTLRNLNTPEDYFAALKAAGLALPEEASKASQND